MSRISTKFAVFAVCLFSLLLVVNVFAQETTGGLQGTVKDPSGAVVANATVELTSPAMGGKKKLRPTAAAIIALPTSHPARTLSP